MSEPETIMAARFVGDLPTVPHPRPDPHFAPVGEGPHCLCCQVKLEWLEYGSETGEKNDQVVGAGNLELWCHYGSRHDMMMGFDPTAKPLVGYLCDKCITRAKEAKLLR